MEIENTGNNEKNYTTLLFKITLWIHSIVIITGMYHFKIMTRDFTYIYVMKEIQWVLHDLIDKFYAFLNVPFSMDF